MRRAHDPNLLSNSTVGCAMAARWLRDGCAIAGRLRGAAGSHWL
jgi:hypothetical protein